MSTRRTAAASRPRGARSTTRARSRAWAAVAFWPAMVLIPGAIALSVAVAGDRRRARRTRRTALVAALGPALALGLARWQLTRLFTKEPTHELERRIGALEVRRYAPLVRAETDVAGTSWDDALDAGFRRLARYIFGGNIARERLGMTTPVTSRSRRARGEGEKVAMTTPVTTHARDGVHTIAFVMPEGRSIDDLPIPEDERVRIAEVPERRVAVLRFRGAYDGTRTAEKQRELLDLVRREGLVARGEPSFAGYDPPWTLPFLRRQEVWVEIA